MRKILSILAIAAVMTLGLALPVAANGGYQVTVSPELDANIVGEQHTVTVTISPALEAPATVEFYIYDGPNYDEGATVNLIAGDTQATFTYAGDDGPGFDVIAVTVDGALSYYAEVYKVWLTDKFSGGGEILQDTGGKKKDFYKISWGGWAGTVYDGLQIGAFEVTFHNIGVNELDGAKFVSADEWMGLSEMEIDYYFDDELPPADPPESQCNKAEVRMYGYLLDKDGNMISGDWGMTIYALDAGEPSVADGIAFELWDGAILVYASYYYDFEVWSYEPLAGGNLQIVVPPVLPP